MLCKRKALAFVYELLETPLSCMAFCERKRLSPLPRSLDRRKSPAETEIKIPSSANG